MAKSAALIQSNSQVYRVYSRRLANPADKDIFIVAASKLTAFLSDSRAYYAEAQRSIVDVLEIARNSLKNVAPNVFSKPGSLDKSAIPPDKASLFDAFDKLTNSVTPYISLFADESLKNRLVSFLSSIGVSLPREVTNVPPPNTPNQISATPSSTGHQADLPASQAESASPIEPASPDIVDLTVGSPSTLRGLTTLPTPAPDRAPSPEAKGNDSGAIAQPTLSRQATQSPVGESHRLSPPSQAPVVNPARVEPNRTLRIPSPSSTTSPTLSSLQAKPSSAVSVPGVVPQSSQKIPENTSVTPSPAPSNLTSRNLPSIPPSLVSIGQVEVAQVLQSVPPPQVQTPIHISASVPVFSTSSGQNEPKPPRRRQSAGLDFLQLDLQVAREKKLRAVRLASVAQNSATTTQASSGAVPSPSTKVVPAAASALPTSVTTDGIPNSPAAQTLMPTVPAAARAPPPLLTGTTHPHTPAITSSVSNTTSPLQKTQTPSPGLVHRDLRQGIRTTSTSPRMLRITDRAPVPAPEPGSSSAPIVVDEDVAESTSTPADEPMEVDAPMQALLQTEETAMVIDDQDVQGSNEDTRDDRKPQHDQEERILTEQQNTSAPQVVSHRHVSDYVPSATGTSGVDVIPAQSSSAPSTSTPLSDFATPLSATPSSGPGPSSLSVSLCDKPSGTEQAKGGKEQGKTAEVCVEGQGNGPSTLRRDSTHIAVGVITMPKGKVAEMAAPAPATTASMTDATGSSAALDYPTISVQPVVVRSTSSGPISLAVPPPEKGGSETSVDPPFSLRPAVWQTPSIPSGNVVVSSLHPPRTPLHPSTESLSDMDVSCCSDVPPIEVLGARSGGSESNPSSDSRSISPPSGKKVSEAGINPVKVEEADDEMVDELEPLFGKEMTVICMDRLHDIAGEFTWEFTLSKADWDRVSRWAGAPEIVDSDISQARCITLACYSKRELDTYVIQDCLTREQWFENVRPVPWANLPRYIWGVINDRFSAVFPPCMSPDDLFDFSPFLKLGRNRICFTQTDGMAEYVFVLHGHGPTRGQLVPVHARWEQERSFREHVASILDRPFIIEDW